jgi:hypothetical protein
MKAAPGDPLRRSTSKYIAKADTTKLQTNTTL